MAHKPDQAGGQSNITLNASLLSATLGISIICVALSQFTLSTEQTGPASLLATVLASVALLGTTGYALYKLVQEQRRLKEMDISETKSICTSAFLGGILLSLTAIMLNGLPTQNGILSIFTLLLGICSCAGYLFCIRPEAEPVPAVFAQEPQQPPRRQQQLLQPLPLPQSVEMAPTAVIGYPNKQNQTVKKPRTEGREQAAQLPPLFLDDPLYRLPSPRTSLVFSVGKTRKHSVFNEDACTIDASETLFALCDGASSSALPRPWAVLLGEQWTQYPPSDQELIEENLETWLRIPRQRWEEWLHRTWQPEVNKRNQLTGDNHQITDEEVERIIHKGAAAAFLGIRLNRQQRSWRAVSVGDTCLFQLRKSTKGSWSIIFQMPLQHSDEFTSRPPLLRSLPQSQIARQDIRHLQSIEGQYASGDKFILATDALARWIMSQNEHNTHEHNATSWISLIEIMDEQSFRTFIEILREKQTIELDDTTMVHISL